MPEVLEVHTVEDLFVRTHDRASSASLVLVAACPASHKCPMPLVGPFRSVQMLTQEVASLE